MDAVVGESQITYDARGLVEVDDTVLGVAVVKDGKATIDASELTTRKINLEIRSLVYEQGIEDVTILNPGGKHSLGVGILTRCKMTFEGSLGYFALGVIDGPEVTVNGRVGWSACENMMSGVVVINGNAGSLTGAAIRGGDLVIKGRVGARTGIDQKGGTIIITGDAGSNTGFMMQRGRQLLLGADCVPGEMTDEDLELVTRKMALYDLGTPPELQKFVCGKKLYNYDNLEPHERKLVL